MNDFFQCVMCPGMVEVLGPNSDVWLRMVDGQWQIICDRCAALLQREGFPCMRIAFGMLKEKPRGIQ